MLSQHKRDRRDKRLALSSHLLNLLTEEVPTGESHDDCMNAHEGCKSNPTESHRTDA
ncbi:hypothetical protein HZ994_07035 [Akkermansiaceae bacterium]|nr:hypothetical protein HZ994_07035 [Akkermansiaceae bacterium]